jgi:hypothetical protein
MYAQAPPLSAIQTLFRASYPRIANSRYSSDSIAKSPNLLTTRERVFIEIKCRQLSRGKRCRHEDRDHDHDHDRPCHPDHPDPAELRLCEGV